MASDIPAPAEPFSQQVMSPSHHAGSRLQGEDHGPDYTNMPQGHGQGAQEGGLLVNGVDPVVASSVSQEFPAELRESTVQQVPGATEVATAAAMEAERMQRTADYVAVTMEPGVIPEEPLRLPTQPSEQRLGEASGGVSAFLPSPLPGQSPMGFGNRRDAETRSSRASTWFARLGDLFQQRRVEVTTWSQSPTNRAMENPWASQAPFVSAPSNTMTELRTGAHTPPSSGSAGVPREMVQAEVAKQLEGAMAEVYQNMMTQVNAERQRTEHAERETQQLRAQLEQMEQRMVMSAAGTNPVDLPSLLQLCAGPSTMVGARQEPVPPPGLSGECGNVGVDPSIPAKSPMTKFPAMSWLHGNAVHENGDGYFQQPPPPAQVPTGCAGGNATGPARGSSPDEGRGRRFLQGLFGTRGSMSQGPPPAASTAPQGLQAPPSGMAPPPIPSIASANLGGSERVLTAMAKGIETLLMNQNSKGEKPETVKPGITELPMLPIYTPETGSIDLINWVTHITPIMEDLSDSSSMWWSSVLKEVMEWYSRYSVAAPLERVQMLPVISMMVNKPEWTRVERRATAMLLSAIPASLKEEVIAVGGVNTLNLLAKLFSTYQPGNRQEKALVLTNLEKPTECQDAASAVEALRKWALWRRRATAIGITEPDASVLLQGLDRICQGVVRSDSELAFRVSLIRSTLQVDVCPTASGVTKFFQHLQAELEQQARLATVKQITPTPKIKALTNTSETTSVPTTPAPPPKTQSTQCRFFASEKGCRRGSQCRYPHTWSAFDRSERAKRCLTCGAVGHKSKECRAPGGGAATKPKDQQGGATAKDPPATPSSAPSSTGSSPTTRRVTIEASSDIAMKVMSVLQEVKGMQALQPLVCAVERWSSMWGTKLNKRNALMDSGATHALRRPRDEKEWLDAVNVNVALAGEAKTTMRQTSNGTLLSGDELSQVIVPLGRVIDSLGYRLRWSANECSLEKEGEVLPLKVVRGCPEVDENTAYRLIQELENLNPKP